MLLPRGGGPIRLLLTPAPPWGMESVTLQDFLFSDIFDSRRRVDQAGQIKDWKSIVRIAQGGCSQHSSVCLQRWLREEVPWVIHAYLEARSSFCCRYFWSIPPHTAGGCCFCGDILSTHQFSALGSGDLSASPSPGPLPGEWAGGWLILAVSRLRGG